MIYYEVVEDMGDGSNAVRKFKTAEEANLYCNLNEEWCYDGYDVVDTDSPNFFDTVEDEEEN